MDTQLKSKKIPTTEGFYSIREDGMVRSHDRFVPHMSGMRLVKGRWMKTSSNDKGHMYIMLEGNKLYIHRLVAEAFLANPENYPVVHHKDEDPTNNKVGNLEWCTQQYNVEFSRCKVEHKLLSPDGTVYTFKSINNFCKGRDIDTSAISKVLRGVYPQHKGWTKC